MNTSKTMSRDDREGGEGIGLPQLRNLRELRATQAKTPSVCENPQV